MDLETIKKELISIIETSKNVSDIELTSINNSQVYVKKGLEAKAQSYAYLYYTIKNNTSDVPSDYLEKVFAELTTLELDSTLIENLETLKKDNHQKYLDLLEDQINCSQEYQNLLAQIKQNDDETTVIKTAKDLVALEEKKKSIITKRNNLQKDNNKEFMTLLIQFKEELLKNKISLKGDLVTSLENIINNSPVEQELILIADLFYVEKSQAEEAQTLIAKIGLNNVKSKENSADLTTLNAEIAVLEQKLNLNNLPSSEEVSVDNSELIERLTKKLKDISDKRIASKQEGVKASNSIKVLESDLEIYEALLKIVTIAKDAQRDVNKYSKKELYKIDDKLTILKKDLNKYNEALIVLYRHELINKFQDDVDMIPVLEAKLDELGQRISLYKDKRVPMEETKKIGDKSWMVLKEDLTEANNYVEMLELIYEAQKLKKQQKLDDKSKVPLPVIQIKRTKAKPKISSIPNPKISIKLKPQGTSSEEITSPKPTDTDTQVPKSNTFANYGVLTPAYSNMDLINAIIEQQRRDTDSLNDEDLEKLNIPDDDIPVLMENIPGL